MTLLHVENAHKRFGRHQALAGVDLRVEHGEIVCLLGASGSGKTTLLRVVAGLETLDAGRISLAGTVADDAGSHTLPPERRHLGMVFQDYALWPHLSALDNVALPLRSRRQRDAAKQAQAMLERVGLAAQAQRRPHELSGGQQQRVALARALAVRPRLLLCDEPLSNLDASLREELRELIAEVIREHGLSALYITHDQREAFALGDCIGVMQAGSLLQVGTAAALWQSPATEAVAGLTHAFGPWPARVEAGLLHAPWGTSLLPSTATRPAEGAVHVCLRESALGFGRDFPDSLPVHAKAVGDLPTGQGVEMRCAMHGVTVRLHAAAALPAGVTVLVNVDPSQALVYPQSQMESLAA